MLEFALLLVAAYLVGAVPTAYLLVKWIYKTDIRRYGSGSVGAANVFRNFSKPLGILVGLYDAGKGVPLVWTASLLDMGLTMQIAVGAVTVIGHNWPVFLRFNAGRGLATTMGVAAYLFPWGILFFIAGALFTLLLGSSPLPVLIGLAAVPLASWLLQEPLELTLGLLGLFLLLVFRRLSAPLTARSATVSKRELFLNRFLFDRDIRDGKAWITFKPVTPHKLKGCNIKKENGDHSERK
ncbi:MAG: glycerol-3-phosphate acyltransferase [Dehalococcoidales bacterium]|nr:glycerol-3-phosphate acyltransferase [Dehalococcoidales bacterium]